MRLTPERLCLLGQPPRERRSVTIKGRTPGPSTQLGQSARGAPFTTLHLPRSRGMTSISQRMTAWYLRTVFEAGHSIEYATEMDPDYLEERIRSRYNQDRARTGRWTVEDSRKESLRNAFAMNYRLRGRTEYAVVLDDTPFPVQHHISMGTSVPCRTPCPFCVTRPLRITQGAPKNIPHGWKWKT